MPKYVVRYGVMRHLGVFSSRARDRYARGHRVIARTGRGQESGEVLCEATEHVLSQMPEDHRTGQILRLESHEDSLEQRRIEEQEQREHDQCEQRIQELGLDMKLVEIERLYGGERVIVYYLAEQRVDFRELVKLLAKDLQTRVEMRHIGVRDEAKLLADYGDCGKPVCCNTHLSEMPPVSMKMAKLQKATLDPTKISGRCGRLKCCLRYEYDTYQELQRELPKIGFEVVTTEGRAKVLSQEILTGELLVETEDSRRVVIQSSQVLTVLGKAAPKQRPAKDPFGQSKSDGPGGGGPAAPAEKNRKSRQRNGAASKEKQAADAKPSTKPSTNNPRSMPHGAGPPVRNDPPQPTEDPPPSPETRDETGKK